MQPSFSTKPHGNELKNLLVEADRAVILKELSLNLPDVILKDHHLCDFELLATGAFSPLEGFMVRADYEPVLDRLQLRDGTTWPLPICLDITETRARNLEAGQSIALRDPEGFLLGVMHVEDIWPIDHEKEMKILYGQKDDKYVGSGFLVKLGIFRVVNDGDDQKDDGENGGKHHF